MVLFSPFADAMHVTTVIERAFFFPVYNTFICAALYIKNIIGGTRDAAAAAFFFPLYSSCTLSGHVKSTVVSICSLTALLAKRRRESSACGPFVASAVMQRKNIVTPDGEAKKEQQFSRLFLSPTFFGMVTLSFLPWYLVILSTRCLLSLDYCTSFLS